MKHRRFSRTTVAVALLVTVLAVGVPYALGQTVWGPPDDVTGEPVLSGTAVKVASGSNFGLTWSLYAQQSDVGVCLDLQHSGYEMNGGGGGCGFNVPGENVIGVVETKFSGGSFIYGPVTTAVSTVKLLLSDDTTIVLQDAAIYTSPNSDVAYYLKGVASTAVLVQATALDADGNVLQVIDL